MVDGEVPVRKTHTFMREDGVGPAKCLWCGMLQSEWDHNWECSGEMKEEK